jgi:transcriptional regulator with XRE-family HTH domain
MPSETREVADRSTELAAFLRARRADVSPETVGLEASRNRRVRGLRREEVAQLAMISTDYYTRLEQGRLASASEEVLDALATALRLNPDERNYLYRLANKDGLHRGQGRHPRGVRLSTRRLLEDLQDSTAVVMDRYFNLLAWNNLAALLLKDFATVESRYRNFLRMIFLDPEFRSRFVEWDSVAREAVAYLRASAPHESRLTNLIGELSLSDTEFRTWWAERHVTMATFGTRVYAHPGIGPYTVDWQVLSFPENDSILWLTTASRGTERLGLLLGSPDGRGDGT